jgi:hypothetical protein
LKTVEPVNAFQLISTLLGRRTCTASTDVRGWCLSTDQISFGCIKLGTFRQSTMSALGISHQEKRMSNRWLPTLWTSKLPNSESRPKPNRPIQVKQRINERRRCFVARNKLISADKNPGNRQPAYPTQEE